MRIVIILQLIGCGPSLAAAPNTPNIPDGSSPALVMLGDLDAHRSRKEEIVQIPPPTPHLDPTTASRRKKACIQIRDRKRSFG